MRLIGFAPFLIIGIVAGLFATKLFNRSAITAVANCALGVLAAAFGLFMRDVFGFESGVLTGLMTAAIRSVVIVFLVNAIAPLFYGNNHPTNQ